MLRLLRAQARRDRWQLLIWILSTGLFAAFSATAVLSEFGGLRERTALMTLAASNPALLAIRGLPDGVSAGSVISFQVSTYLAIMAALMSTFLTVRHSRGDEERGRSELVGSTPVSRSSSLAATLGLGALANVGVVIAVSLGFGASGLPAGGSILSGLATGAVGIAFCGVAAVAAQLARSSRAANSLAGAAIAAAFVLRAFGDALGTPDGSPLRLASSWPSWLSPIGWAQQVRPFGEAAALPLLLDVALAGAGTTIAVVLVRRRDLGSGVVGERPGRARAARSLSGSFGLAWRLHRGAVIGWSAGALLLGVFAGGLADPAVAAVKANAAIRDAVGGLVPGGTAGLLDTFVAAIMAFLGVLAAGVAVQAVLRVRSEETDGHTELVSAGAVHRSRLVLDALGVAVLSIVIVLVVGGLSGGLAFVAAGHPDRFGITLAAALVQLPAAAMFAAASALVLVLVPRLTVPVGWGLLAIGFVLGQFGGLFRLPDWVRDISPFTHTPVLPGSDVRWWPAIVVLLVAVGFSLAAAALTRRRDLLT
ncbi:MAG: polyketide antibiotic transporter [Actinomycetota bacterium]